MKIKTINIIFSVFLISFLVIAFIFYPESSSIFSAAIFVLSIGAAITFTIYCNWEILRQAQEPEKSSGTAKKQFVRNTLIDLLGLALTMGAAIWLGRWAGGYAGQAVGINIGLGWGMIAGIVVGMVAGFTGALIAGRIWGRVSEPLRVA